MTAGNAQLQNGLANAAPAPAVEWEDAQGQTRTAPLSRAGLTIGSAPGNAIELAGDAIARYHLRIDWDGRQVVASALSARGATIGATPLPQPPTPGMVWDGTVPLVVGSYRLRLSRATPMAQQAPVATPASTLEIRLEGNAEYLELTPGKPETIRSRILNRSAVREAVQVSVEGLPPEWVQVTPATVQPGPSLPAIVIITLDVPRESGSRAGSYPVTIRAAGERGVAERSLRWGIAAFAEQALELRPARAEVANEQPASYSVGVRNTGNATMSYDLHAGYDDPALEYRLERTSIVVEPGKEQRVALRVQARERLSSREQVHRFSVESVPASGPSQVSTAAYARRRQLPLWVWPVALGALILLIGLTGRVVAGMLPRPTPATQEAALPTGTNAPPASTDTPLPPTAIPFPTFPPSETPNIPAITGATQTAAAFVNQVGTAQSGGTAAVDAALAAAQQAGSTAAALAAAAVAEQAQQAAAAQAQQAAQQAANESAVSQQAQQGVAGTTRAIAAQTEQAAPVAALQTTVAVLQFTPTPTPTSTQTSTPTNTPTETQLPTPTPRADLRISIEGSANPIAAGGVLTYTIRVDNFGPEQATALQITSQLPGSVTYTGTDRACNESAGFVRCDLPTLGATASVSFTLPVRVLATSGTLVNAVRVDAATFDPTPGNNTDSETTTVAIATDLEITIDASADQVGAGQPLTYTLTLRNAGGNPAQLPSILTEVNAGDFQSGVATPPDWECSGSGRRITCDSGTPLAPGGVITATLLLRAPDQLPATGVLTGTAIASSNTLDPNLGNNERSVVTTIVPAADLAIEFLADRIPGPLYADEPFTYVLQVSNSGPNGATRVQVKLTLPDQTTYLPDPPPEGWGCELAQPELTCTRVENLPAGGEAELSVRVEAPAAPGPIDATVMVSAETLDPDVEGEANRATLQLIIQGKADLTILSFGPDEANVPTDAAVPFTLEIRNQGPSTAEGVEANLTLDEPLRFVGTTSTGWTCDPPTSPTIAITQLTCDLPLLNSGNPSTLELNFTAPATSGGPAEGPLSVTLDASLSSSTFERDETKGDNDENASIRVYQPPSIDPLALPSPPYILISPATYAITVTGPVVITIDATVRGTALTYDWIENNSVECPPTSTNSCTVTLAPPLFPGTFIDYGFTLNTDNEVSEPVSESIVIRVFRQSP